MHAEFMFHFREPDMHDFVVGINLAQRQECIVGFLIRSDLEMGKPQELVTTRVLRLEFRETSRVEEGFFVLMEFVSELSQGFQKLSVAVLLLESFFEYIVGERLLPLVDEIVPEVHIGIGLFGVMMEDDVAEKYLCLFEILLHLVELGKKDIEVLVVPVDHQSFDDLGARLFVLADDELRLYRFEDVLQRVLVFGGELFLDAIEGHVVTAGLGIDLFLLESVPSPDTGTLPLTEHLEFPPIAYLGPQAMSCMEKYVEHAQEDKEQLSPDEIIKKEEAHS